MDEYKRLYKIYIQKSDDELKSIINSNGGYTEIAIKVANDILVYGRIDCEMAIEKQGGHLSFNSFQKKDSISENADSNQKRTPSWKLIISVLCGLIAVIVLISAAYDFWIFSQKKSEIHNPLTEKIYYLNNSFASTLREKFGFDYVKFYDDNTFQGIKIGWIYNQAISTRTATYENYFGTYYLNNNALELNLFDKTYFGVISDNGNTILFGNEEFIDYSDGDYSAEFLSQFKQ